MTQCPNCHSCEVKKNGKTHYGKQNYKCKLCSRQFVLDNTHTIAESTKELVRRSLCERLSLRAICRISDVSLTWLMGFAVSSWRSAPDDLGVSEELLNAKRKRLKIIGLQLDEMWSFVGKKKNKAWVWIAYEPQFKQVIAFHIGNRGIDAARALWAKIPERLRENCYFETDEWEAYDAILPFERHYTGKDETYWVEGFLAGVRARVSRLVRKSLSFSKSWENHISAIRYFFWNFNLDHQPYI
jgi:insertion element IS1 protein InsB